MKTFILVAFTFIFSVTVKAQDTSLFHFTFNHLALSVKDPAVSVDFYKNVFQLQEINNRTKKEGIRWMSMGQDKELHFISIIKEPFIINKAIHLSLTTPHFDAFARRLDSLHITYSDWPGVPHTITKRADGISQLYLQDPDGYWVEVNNVGQ